MRTNFLKYYRIRSARAISLFSPSAIWILFFGIAPFGLIVFYSFLVAKEWGGIKYVLTINNYIDLIKPQYFRVLLNSIMLGGLSTIICLILGYPLAYWLTFYLKKKLLTLFLFLITIPIWIAYVMRAYSWMFLLDDNGVVNNLLMSLNFINNPISLLYNNFAVVLGLIYCYLPFMILPLYTSLDRLNFDLLEAAADIGANPIQRFLKITLPLTKGGVMSGIVLVFAPSVGNYVIPALMGGARVPMIAPLLRRKFLVYRDWPFGAVLALLIAGITIAILVTAIRIAGGEEIYEELA